MIKNLKVVNFLPNISSPNMMILNLRFIFLLYRKYRLLWKDCTWKILRKLHFHHLKKKIKGIRNLLIPISEEIERKITEILTSPSQKDKKVVDQW